MTSNRSVNRLRRIALSRSVNDLFNELIADCKKRVSLLRPFGKQERAEQELKTWEERRALIDSYQSDSRLPRSLRKQIAEMELLMIKSKDSQFGLANQSYLLTTLQSLFDQAEVIRNRVTVPSVDFQSQMIAVEN